MNNENPPADTTSNELKTALVPTVPDSSATGAGLTSEQQAEVQAWIKQIQARRAAEKQLLRDKYYAKKKVKLAMRKASQKAQMRNSKNFKKRQAKRDAKARAASKEKALKAVTQSIEDITRRF